MGRGGSAHMILYEKTDLYNNQYNEVLKEIGFLCFFFLKCILYWLLYKLTVFSDQKPPPTPPPWSLKICGLGVTTCLVF